MISREHLKDASRASGFHLYQQEKDYLIKLFLYNYFRRFDDAVFKEGTCLRYLYGTDRFSDVIDFNITVSPSKFGRQTEKVLKEIALVGIDNGLIKKKKFADAYTSEIWFHGPLYEGSGQTRNKFRIDAGKRGGTVKRPRWELIRSEYPETKEQFLVQVMAEPELLAEKVVTLMTRKKGRDLYDVWFLLKKGVEIDKKLIGRKTGSKLKKLSLPSKKEYLADMGKLATRTIPYRQVLKDVEKDLKAVLAT